MGCRNDLVTDLILNGAYQPTVIIQDCVKSLNNKVAMVVLPLVPVTPTSFNFSEG